MSSVTILYHKNLWLTKKLNFSNGKKKYLSFFLKGDSRSWPFCPIFPKASGIPSVFYANLWYLWRKNLYIPSVVSKKNFAWFASKRHKLFSAKKCWCFLWKIDFLRYFFRKIVFNDNNRDLLTLVYVVSYYKNKQYLHTGVQKNFDFKKTFERAPHIFLMTGKHQRNVYLRLFEEKSKTWCGTNFI